MPSKELFPSDAGEKSAQHKFQPSSDDWLTALTQNIWGQPAKQVQSPKIMHSIKDETLAMHPVFSAHQTQTEAQLQAKVADVASHVAGKSMYLPREDSAFKGYRVTPTFGCASASTNLFFDGLKAAGRVSESDYRHIHQINNDRAYKMLQQEHLAKPVATKEIGPGDWVYFKDKGESSGHSGVVFRGKNGKLLVANNTSGKMVVDSLSDMEDDYDSTRALRPIL